VSPVVFGDLDAVERWLGEALEGRLNVLSQSGCVAGAPAGAHVVELASWRPIAGEPPRPSFPDPLA
jgi:hypothetical protein